MLFIYSSSICTVVFLFQSFERLQITTWGHDPAVVPTSNVLISLNDALSHSPVLVQVSASSTLSCLEHLSDIPFLLFLPHVAILVYFSLIILCSFIFGRAMGSMAKET